eukprot:gnl/MRDRNA2_/MRDRNA2_106636_c0_seq1.p1 gnl/MRDRNA2_/MRDRNA2_106636_c0~~gnl/MRDRNA2_/MRDRNA2_106636_c0_seq1.p1  ORF type:complete len:198 (-),score=29.73 gnl/MRDRNA2_/MRDRNA2_106636_c0_seq1:164-757(-)
MDCKPHKKHGQKQRRRNMTSFSAPQPKRYSWESIHNDMDEGVSVSWNYFYDVANGRIYGGECRAQHLDRNQTATEKFYHVEWSHLVCAAKQGSQVKKCKEILFPPNGQHFEYDVSDILDTEEPLTAHLDLLASNNQQMCLSQIRFLNLQFLGNCVNDLMPIANVFAFLMLVGMAFKQLFSFYKRAVGSHEPLVHTEV